MNAFQYALRAFIASHPGVTMQELALALGHKRLSGNHQRFLRWLVVRGLVECKQVPRFQQRGIENIYRAKG